MDGGTSLVDRWFNLPELLSLGERARVQVGFPNHFLAVSRLDNSISEAFESSDVAGDKRVSQHIVTQFQMLPDLRQLSLGLAW